MLAASFVFYGGLGLALHVPAGRLDRRQPVLRRAASTARRRRRRGKRWTAAAVVANLGALGWFKYVGFLAESAGGVLDGVGLDGSRPSPTSSCPIGISFFTFQALSYVIDVHRRKLHPARLLDFAVYLSFFPHLVAGPIVRASEFLPQLRQRRDPRRVAGDPRVLAHRRRPGEEGRHRQLPRRARSSIPLFGFPGQHGGVEALVGVYAYAIQIYADFSGYTDMAIGLALLLGFRFPQNFDAPVHAASLQDFWRRWHMTLSRWLRDYLYIPLGGNQGGPPPHLPQPDAHDGARRPLARRRVDLRDLGRDSTAAGSAPSSGGWERRHRPRSRPALGSAAAPVRSAAVVTFNVVCLGWVFFRSAGVGRGLRHPRSHLRRHVHGPVEPDGRRRRRRHARQPVRPGRDRAAGSGPASAGGRSPPRPSPSPASSSSSTCSAPQGVAPFIYFQF